MNGKLAMCLGSLGKGVRKIASLSSSDKGRAIIALPLCTFHAVMELIKPKMSPIGVLTYIAKATEERRML